MELHGQSHFRLVPCGLGSDRPIRTQSIHLLRHNQQVNLNTVFPDANTWKISFGYLVLTQSTGLLPRLLPHHLLAVVILIDNVEETAGFFGLLLPVDISEAPCPKVVSLYLVCFRLLILVNMACEKVSPGYAKVLSLLHAFKDFILKAIPCVH